MTGISDSSSDKSASAIIKVPGDAVDQAAADVIKAVAGDTAKGLSNFSGNLFAGLLGDRISEWKTRNLIKQCRRTAEFLQDQGIPLADARSLPNGELYALFSGMSEADQPSIQELWSSLLARRMSVDGTEDFDPEVVATLRAFTSSDAHAVSQLAVLIGNYDRTIWAHLFDKRKMSDLEGTIFEITNSLASKPNDAIQGMNKAGFAIEVSLKQFQKLERLGLISRKDVAATGTGLTSSPWSGQTDTDQLGFKNFLESFLKSIFEAAGGTHPSVLRSSKFQAQKQYQISDSWNYFVKFGVLSECFSLTDYGRLFLLAVTADKYLPNPFLEEQ